MNTYPKNTSESPTLYWVTTAIAYSLPLLGSIISLNTEIPFVYGDASLPVVIFCLGYAILFGFGFKEVKEYEIAGAIYFGKPCKQFSQQWCFIVPFIGKLRRDSRLDMQNEFKTEIMAGSPKWSIKGSQFEGDSLHSGPLRLPIGIIVRYKFNRFLDFIGRIGNKENLKKQLRDASVRSMEEAFSHRTPAMIIAQRKAIDSESHLDLRERVGDFEGSNGKCWGVEILDVHLIEPNFDQLKDTFGERIASQIKAEVTVISAEAQGKARIILDESKGIGIKKIADELGITQPEYVLMLETIENSIGEADKILAIPGLNQLFEVFSKFKLS